MADKLSSKELDKYPRGVAAAKARAAGIKGYEPPAGDDGSNDAGDGK